MKKVTALIFFLLLTFALAFLFRISILEYALPKISTSFGLPIHQLQITTLSQSQLEIASLEIEPKINSIPQIVKFKDLSIIHSWTAISKIRIGAISLAEFPEIEISTTVEIADKTFPFKLTAFDKGGIELAAEGIFDSKSSNLNVLKFTLKGQSERAVSQIQKIFPLPENLELLKGSFFAEGNFSADSSGLTELNLKRISLQAWGGTVSSNNISFKPNSPTSNFTLILKQIDLAKLLLDYPQQMVTATGTISGKLPVRYQNGAFLIDAAKLQSDPGGGLLKLDSNEAAQFFENNPGLATARDVLKDYRYKTLETVTNLTDNGDLKIDFALSGFNPTFQNGREVNLNLSIQENLPALLKSIQLKDGIEKSALESLHR